uniref:Uncharacterized protein n=1 Tax=viral metagenome TaxID=1070528 RepID=A0A6C0C4C4_9ZZZZ
MTRIVLLTDENIVEGVIGMMFLAITSYILSRVISAPRSVILGMAFIISWYVRRIGSNLYLYGKKEYNISISPITYEIE